MSNSYKFYSDTKDIMKKYVNATEGAIIYGISKSRIMVLASEAGAVYKVGNSALINTDMRSINEQCVRQLNGEIDESEMRNIYLSLTIKSRSGKKRLFSLRGRF